MMFPQFLQKCLISNASKGNYRQERAHEVLNAILSESGGAPLKGFGRGKKQSKIIKKQSFGAKKEDLLSVAINAGWVDESVTNQEELDDAYCFLPEKVELKTNFEVEGEGVTIPDVNGDFLETVDQSKGRGKRFKQFKKAQRESGRGRGKIVDDLSRTDMDISQIFQKDHESIFSNYWTETSVDELEPYKQKILRDELRFLLTKDVYKSIKPEEYVREYEIQKLDKFILEFPNRTQKNMIKRFSSKKSILQELAKCIIGHPDQFEDVKATLQKRERDQYALNEENEIRQRTQAFFRATEQRLIFPTELFEEKIFDELDYRGNWWENIEEVRNWHNGTMKNWDHVIHYLLVEEGLPEQKYLQENRFLKWQSTRLKYWRKRFPDFEKKNEIQKYRMYKALKEVDRFEIKRYSVLFQKISVLRETLNYIENVAENVARFGVNNGMMGPLTPYEGDFEGDWSTVWSETMKNQFLDSPAIEHFERYIGFINEHGEWNVKEKRHLLQELIKILGLQQKEKKENHIEELINDSEDFLTPYRCEPWDNVNRIGYRWGDPRWFILDHLVPLVDTGIDPCLPLRPRFHVEPKKKWKLLTDGKTPGARWFEEDQTLSDFHLSNMKQFPVPL